MNKKILLFSLLLTSTNIAQAQTISLNPLLEISQKNFCYQTNKYSSIEKFFKINNTTNLSLLGKPVIAMTVGQPVLEINETQEHLKKTLAQYNNNKFTEYDIKNINIKNIYSIQYTAEIELDISPVELTNLIAKRYSGIQLNTDSYGGSFKLINGTRPDFNQAKNVKDFNQLLENISSSEFNFSIRKNNQHSVLSYRCNLTILNENSPQEVANQIIN